MNSGHSLISAKQFICVRLAVMAILTLFLSSCHEKRTTERYVEQQTEIWMDSARQHINQQNYRKAIVALKRAEETAQGLNNDSLTYTICQHMAWVNERSGASHAALHYAQRALKAAEQAANAKQVIDALLANAHSLFNIGLADSAYQLNQRALRLIRNTGDYHLSTARRQEAYYEILTGEPTAAEQHAREAIDAATDKTELSNARSLLCQILIRDGRQHEAERLMQKDGNEGTAVFRHNQLLLRSELLENEHRYAEALDAARELWQFDDSVSQERQRLDIVRLQSNYDRAMLKQQRARQDFMIMAVAVAALLLTIILATWYFLHTQTLYQRYHNQVSALREEMSIKLVRRDTMIDELKATLDERMEALRQMERRLPGRLRHDESVRYVNMMKEGIDVLSTIVSGGNISQMGKHEQQAVTAVMQLIDPAFHSLLADEKLALTPKETFYCIMEHNRQDDHAKAKAFCSTEQAVRSIKSRLGKKLDLSRLGETTSQRA